MARKEASSGQESDWRDGFLFVGNHPALDFLNTRPVQDAEFVELIPDFHSLLRWLHVVELVDRRETVRLDKAFGASSRAKRVHQSVLELRERLRSQVIEWEQGRTVNPLFLKELNQSMEQHPILTRINIQQPQSLEHWFKLETPESLIGPLAYSAAKLFAEQSHVRVRQCGSCVLHFLDVSKKGTRHWCSMKLCGNRHKVAAYAARQKSRDVRG